MSSGGEKRNSRDASGFTCPYRRFSGVLLCQMYDGNNQFCKSSEMETPLNKGQSTVVLVTAGFESSCFYC
jgi:hypothetical protein